MGCLLTGRGVTTGQHRSQGWPWAQGLLVSGRGGGGSLISKWGGVTFPCENAESVPAVSTAVPCSVWTS